MQQASATEAVTMAGDAIHNPNEPRHFMRAKPVAGTVRILLGDRIIAETKDALRVMEVGRDFYDPVFYLPRDALKAELKQVPEKQTHCPLKGDAIYFELADGTEIAGDYFAWCYSEPFDFSAIIKDRIAFNSRIVTVQELPE